MSRSTIYKRCSLCFTKFEPDGGELIWKDSMQLCPKCYTRYNASAYNQRVMLINSIKCYRRLIGKYEDNGNIQLDCNFDGIDANLKKKEENQENQEQVEENE